METAKAKGERKGLVWNIKKSLLTLSANELFQIAKSLGTIPGVDESRLESADEDGCFQYISNVMSSKALLESEDQGMAHLLQLKDVTDQLTQSCDLPTKAGENGVDAQYQDTQANDTVQGQSSATYTEHEITDDAESDTQNVVTSNDTRIQELLRSYEALSKKVAQYMPSDAVQSTIQPQLRPQFRAQSNSAELPTHEKVVSLRDLSYLHRREFKIQGGQIGDQGSDISYNHICRQIEEGCKEQFSDAEIVRAVLRVIKPGNFKDMLMTKDELTVEELKDFLHSHLGEQSNTELFQELMCTKQNDSETPQQFLYRVIGLKQKILLVSKHTAIDVKYNTTTVQDVFLHTVYQGLGHKHSDLRRELKPLLADPSVTDEAILKHLKKVMSDESERQRRLGPLSRPKGVNAHSAVTEVNAAQGPTAKEDIHVKKQTDKKTDMIQQLVDKVEKLTNLVEHLQSQKAEQTNQYMKGKVTNPRPKRHGCATCLAQDRPDCSHCFYCGEEGHRAVGCLKKPPRQGNWSRSLSRDKQ